MASRDNPVQIKQFRDFSGGMTAPSPTDGVVGIVGDNRFTDLTNFLYDANGMLHAVGYMAAQTLTANVGTDYYSRFWKWVDTAGVVYNIAVDDNGSVFIDAGAYDFSTAVEVAWVEGVNISMAAMGGKIYFATKTTASRSYDGTTWSTMSDTTLDGSGTEFPQAKTILFAHDRMFAFNVKTGGTSYISRIWFSDAGDAETWQSDAWIDVASGDGEQIEGAALFRDVILVFKRSKVYVLSGTDPDSFTITYLAPYGLLYGSRSTVTDGRAVYWLSQDQATIRFFDGSSVGELGKLPFSVGGGIGILSSVGDRLYLGTYSHTGIYDLRANAWSKFDFGYQDMWVDYTSLNQTMYLAGVSFGSGQDDSIYAIRPDYYGAQTGSLPPASYPIWLAESAWISLVDLATRFRVKYVDVVIGGLPSSAANLIIKLYTNYNLDSTAVSKTFAVSDATGVAQRFRLPVPTNTAAGARRVESIKWSVGTDGSASFGPSILGVDIGYTVPPIRQRGSRSYTED